MSRIVEAIDGRRRAPAARRRDRQRQDRGLPAGVRRRARARQGRDRARAGDRADAADAGSLPGPLRRPDRRPPLGADRRGAPRRARADRRGRGARRRRRALRRLRAGAAPRPDLRRRGARLVLQAGVRPALRRPHRRREARCARGRRRGLRERDAEAGELGAARAAGARAVGSGRRCRACGSSTCAARPATRSRRRLLEELGRISEQGGKAILLLNRRGVAPAIHCRACGRLAAVRALRRRADAARRRAAPLPPLRLLRGGARGVPGVRLVRAGADRRRHAAARGRAREAGARSSSGSGSTRIPPRSPVRSARRSTASRRATAPSSSAPRWSRRVTTSPASRSPQSSTPTRGWRCRTSGRRSGRSSS